MYHLKNYIMDVEISLTNNCNLNCSYCYKESENNSILEKELSLSEWKETINKLKESNVMRIIITGGEPFINYNIVEIIEEIFKKKMHLKIFTNGTIKNDSLITLLAENNNMVDYVQVSIDGHCSEINDITRGNGSFEKIIHTIHLLHNKKINVKCRTTLQKNNFNYIKDIYYFLKNQLYVNSIIFSEIRNLGRAQQNKDLLLDMEDYIKIYKEVMNLLLVHEVKLNIINSEIELMLRLNNYYKKNFVGGKMNNCCITFKSLHILSNGDIVPCDTIKNIVLGNIKSIPNLLLFWKESALLNKIRERNNIDLANFEKCKNCYFLNICTGSCPYYDYIQTGSLLKNSYKKCLLDVYNKYKEELGWNIYQN